jgi:hypothetical protein
MAVRRTGRPRQAMTRPFSVSGRKAGGRARNVVTHQQRATTHAHRKGRR